MKVVVTGGSGRIGTWLVRELAPRHVVTIFDRVAPTELPPGVGYKLGDHEDLGSVYDVLHDAGRRLDQGQAPARLPAPLELAQPVGSRQ